MNSNLVSGTKMAAGDAFLTAVLGYATVFGGILLLIIVVTIVGKLMTAANEKKTAEAAAASGSANSAEAVGIKKASREVGKNTLTALSAEADNGMNIPAPGSAGDLKLYDTDPKTAAMIMAIVADNLGKPLNELRFRSIREVKEDEI